MTLQYAQPTPKAPPVVSPPSALEATAQTAATRQMQVAGAGAPLRIVLGEDCIGAQVGPVWYYNGKLYIRCIWALGEAEGVQSVFLNDQPLPADVEAVHYTGTTTQGIDPWLAAAGAAQSPAESYTDTLVFTARGTTFGIAYSVFAVPQRLLTGGLEFKAIFRGLKLYDPRTATTTWADNAGLALRAILASPWGENKTITGGDVDLADRCDELCGAAPNQEKRSRIGITLSARQPASQWRETLRTYAECFVIPDGAGYLLIPDAPASSEYTYSHAADNLLELGSITRAGTNQQPTVITGYYTDRSVTPWRDIAIAPIKRPGVDAGTTPAIPQEIRLNGIFSAGQMTRVCTTRLNKLHLCDLSGDIHTIDDGMQVRAGTVVTLIDPRIGAGKQVRVFGSSGVNGRYVQTWVEHDNAVYSDVVVADPSTPDTSYPLANDPPEITLLNIDEVVAQMQTGRLGTRFNVSWDEPDYPFLDGYRVEVLAGAQLIDTAPVSGAAYTSPWLQEGVTYTIKVATLSPVAQSAWVQDAKLAQGKLLVPGDVPFFNAFELGGTTYMFWTPGTDLDRTGHEIRRAYIDAGETVAQHWARGVVVNRVADPAVTYAAQNEPVGTWRYMIKCLDSVRSALYPFGQESVNGVYKDVVVTSDVNAIWSDTHLFTGHTLTNMHEYNDWPPTRDKYISVGGTSTSTAMPNAADTYPNPTATYDTPASSEFLTTTHDFGAIVSGQWLVEAGSQDYSLANLSGVAVVYIELSDNGSAWVQYSGTSAKASGRFARIRIATTGVMVITGHPTLRVQAVPKTEKHTVTTSASGPVTLTLDHHYIASVGEPQTQAVGSTPIFHSCDNIVVSPTADNTVEVSAWNISGARVATTIGVTFNGILAT